MRALKHRLLTCFLLLFVSLVARPSAAVVPGAPTLTASSYSTTQINLSWTTPSGSPTSYKIYRSSTSNTETLYLPSVAANFKADTGLPLGQAYYYQVSAVNASGEGPLSAEATAITGIPLSLIRGGHEAVTLSWSAGGNAAGYNVYRAETAIGLFTKINSSLITATTYQDISGLTNGKTYSYQLTAVGAGSQESGRSPAFQVTPNVRVNAGGVAVNPDSLGLYWAADTGSSTGVTASTAVSQNNSSGVALPASDQPLYQNQRQEASSGSGITYSLPVNPGVYTLVLGFSEWDTSKVAGSRKFNVKANGQQILTGYDIYASAGGHANQVVTVGSRVTVQGNTLTLVFTGTTDKATVSTIVLAPIAPPVADTPPPGYAAGSIPTDSATSADGAGPASSFSVVLPSLVSENHPGVDISAYNPVGPSVSYERMYRSNLTTAGYFSPGMAVGWTDNFDISITSANAAAWGALTLVYGNQATETFTPTLSGGTPTGAFSHPTGAPYIVTGVPSGTTGQWTSLTLTFKDHTQMTFTPPVGAPSTNAIYLYTQLTNLVGHYVTVKRDAANGNRVTDVLNDAAASVTLLKFNYSGALLASVQDLASATPGDRRQVNYGYSTASLLTSVTQIFVVMGSPASNQWAYGYQPVNSKYYLSVADAPNPANPAGAYARAKLFYDQYGLVSLATDAMGRQTSYLPNPAGNQMLVYNYNVDGTQAMFHRQSYIPTTPGGANNVNGGFIDGSLTHVETMSYTDALNPWMPTLDVNRKGEQTKIAYNDAFGNPQTVTSPRGNTVTNVYDFTNFALGQVTSSQETHVNPSTLVVDATKQATTYTYYGPADGALNGLVKTIISPAPDSTVAAPALVTTTFTYTLPSATSSGGQILTVAAPGNNAGGTLTTTYNYTSDPSYDQFGAAGTYAQSEQPGEPLTVTNPAGNVTHYRYDGRGNVTLSIDASGNETNYVYNIADQLTQTVAPPTNVSTPTARAYTQTNYQYPGGSLASVQVYDESGALVREVDTTYTADGEVASVTGSTEPVAYTYDGLSRVVTLKDGKNNVTNYSYDAVGNLSKIAYPGVSGTFDTLTFGYDANQNLTSKIDGRGITTAYARNVDPESLVTSITYSGLPVGVTPIGTTSYSYDVYGRQSLMTDITGTTAYSNYDDLDEPLLMTRSFTGGPQNQQIAYAHYPDGSRKQMQTPLTTGVNGNLFGYQYDMAGRLTQVQFPWNQGLWGHSYFANGWLKSTSGPKAAGSSFALASSLYNYNPRGFLTSLNNNTAYNDAQLGDTFQAGPGYSQMSYDALGNRLGEKVTLPSMSTFVDTGTMDDFGNEIYSLVNLLFDATHTRTYGYDTAHAAAANRDVLTGEASVLSGGNPSYSSRYKNTWTHSFGYDGAYNPTRYDYYNSSLGDQSFTQLGYTNDNQHLSTDFGSMFGFDGNGNSTTYKGASFSFDPEDRLTAIASPSFSASYDGNGLRATKTVGGVTTYFVYDGSTPVTEETWNGTTATVAATNGWAADGWRARYEGATAFDYLYDPQGNLVQRQTRQAYASGNGAYDQTIYEAYGSLRSNIRVTQATSGGAVTTARDPVGFGGQYGYYTDRETGLLCLTHRYYDPGTGRFLNRDPIGYNGGVNLYGFAGGNPVNFADPSGLDKIYINNPDHYKPSYIAGRKHGIGGTRIPAYRHQKYVIDFPNGQNVDANIAWAILLNNELTSQGNFMDQDVQKTAYLMLTVRDHTIGDYAKNTTAYSHSDQVKNKELYWERRNAANFNLGAIGAALGISIDSLLASGHALRLAHSYGQELHPQTEQDAIEDGFWYFYSKHPERLKPDNITLPTGIKFGYTQSSSIP